MTEQTKPSNLATELMGDNWTRYGPRWAVERWKMDGVRMSFENFVNYIWPEDCPDKVAFIKRHMKYE